MRLAVMMRVVDTQSSLRSYVSNFVEDLLNIDSANRYLLVYRSADYLGRFRSFANVEEIVAPCRSKLVWDQAVFPWVAFRWGADLILNLKFSVPLLAPCPVAMGLQEPAWWEFPDYYEWWDRIYMRLMLPIYVRRCAHLFPTSRFVVDETRRFIWLPADQEMTVLYPRCSTIFRPVTDPARLELVRRTYELPERFILAVTRVEHADVGGARMFFPGKNIQAAVRAFGQIRERIPHELVIAGRSVDRFLAQQGFGPADLARVRLLGRVDHEMLPALHSLADLFVIPSQYEGFSSALLEALACGSAIVASDVGACHEAAGDAALYADPNDPTDLATKILQALGNSTLRAEMRRRSLERAALFSKGRSAGRFLETLRHLSSIWDRRAS